jgi:hypothetical protein
MFKEEGEGDKKKKKEIRKEIQIRLGRWIQTWEQREHLDHKHKKKNQQGLDQEQPYRGRNPVRLIK